MEKIVDVAVGVLIREDGKMLLSSRPEGKPYAGYWEFPGGKIEAGETVHEALARELGEGSALSSGFNALVRDGASLRTRARAAALPPFASLQGHARLQGRAGVRLVRRDGAHPGLLLPVDQAIVNRAALPEVFDDRTDILTLSRTALQATVVRDRKARWVGARVETLDDVLKAVAMAFDFVIVEPENFEALLVNGEARIPTYVNHAPAADLQLWQQKGAHGVKPEA